MSAAAKQRSEAFLKIAGQFKLGDLVTETSHPVTARLSEVAQQDIVAGLQLLLAVDADVVAKYREFVRSGRAGGIAATVLAALENGGRVFFTGCGATGRLSILLDAAWRDFWQKRGDGELEDRTVSVMAGGDYALIKSVEGFEDFAAFGKKQMAGAGPRDVVFAITEGGETSFVIGTAWAGVEAGAKVFFIYNNPDDVLCRHVQRSREIIEDRRIEKINLTTGPMAITGSTRMQATSIQLCVMLTVLEMVVQQLTGTAGGRDLPAGFLQALENLHAVLQSPSTLSAMAGIVALEESTYRGGGRINYFADRFGIDVLTDTTERSPTFCTPAFRKFDDEGASESWAFLFTPGPTPLAWRNLLKRGPRCLDWTEAEVRELVGEDKQERTLETLHKVRREELLRFRIGADGVPLRPLGKGDGAIAIVGTNERPLIDRELELARAAGAGSGLIYLGDSAKDLSAQATAILHVPPGGGDFLLEGPARVAVKLVMNAISTCTMVRLGRVMGNYMVYVVPSNLKLVDRATRYLSQLAGLPYEEANALLFNVIEYVEPRMKSDRAYPPVVALAVLRARERISNESAEARLML